MCARIRTAKDLARIKARFSSAPLFNFPFDPNCGPTDKAPILCADAAGVKWEYARFGLIPFWAKSKKGLPSLHNARSETITEKPAFRQSYQKRRCIVPCEGFYEFVEEGGNSQPYFFSRSDGELTCFAGIWEYSEIEGEKIFSFSILTGEPHEQMKKYHDRMPLIVDDVDHWLDLEQNSLQTISQVPFEMFEIRPMNRAMNVTKVKDLNLIEPLTLL